MKVPSHDYKITMASVTRDMTYNDKLAVIMLFYSIMTVVIWNCF